MDDKTFERGILASNRFYEIVCEDETDPDNECKLQEIKEYTGKVPSKKWLDSNKVCEFCYLLGIEKDEKVKKDPADKKDIKSLQKRCQNKRCQFGVFFDCHKLCSV